MTRITVTLAGKVLTATLEDSPAGRDFAALLPLTLTLTDYHGMEKVADLPRKLETTGAPPKLAAKAGDLMLYAPWGNLAIFYKPIPSTSGLVKLGSFDGSIEPLLQDKPSIAVFEAMA